MRPRQHGWRERRRVEIGKTAECIVAVKVGPGFRLAGIEQSVGIEIEEQVQPFDPRLTAVADAICIGVVEFGPIDRGVIDGDVEGHGALTAARIVRRAGAVPSDQRNARSAREACYRRHEQVVAIDLDVDLRGIEDRYHVERIAQRVRHTQPDRAEHAGEHTGGRYSADELARVLADGRIHGSSVRDVVEFPLEHQCGLVALERPIGFDIGVAARDVPHAEISNLAPEVGATAEVSGIARAEGVEQAQGCAAGADGFPRRGAITRDSAGGFNTVEETVQGQRALVVTQDHVVPGIEVDLAQ